MVPATILLAAIGAYTAPASIRKDLLRPSRSTVTGTRRPGSNSGKSCNPQPAPDGARPSMPRRTSSGLKPACSAGLPPNTSDTTSRHCEDSTRQATVPFNNPSRMPIPEYGTPVLSRVSISSYSDGVISKVLASSSEANIAAEAAQTAAVVSPTPSISAQACSNETEGSAHGGAAWSPRGANPAARTPSAAAAARSSSTSSST